MRSGSYLAKIHFTGHFELILRSFWVVKVINYKLWNKGAFANTSLTSEFDSFLKIRIDSEWNTLVNYLLSEPPVRPWSCPFFYLFGPGGVVGLISWRACEPNPNQKTNIMSAHANKIIIWAKKNGTRTSSRTKCHLYSLWFSVTRLIDGDSHGRDLRKAAVTRGTSKIDWNHQITFQSKWFWWIGKNVIFHEHMYSRDLSTIL